VYDSSFRTHSSENIPDSHEEEPVKAQGMRDSSVQSNDMVEIAMSLRQISNVLESSVINQITSGDSAEESEFWLDDDYLYVDIVYPESDELMMDICVQRGRAFIRVEREGLSMGRVEIPA
jgi:hypothetical protein